MVDVHLVTITWNGSTVFRYMTGAEPGLANSEAGAVMDSLADRFGDGFGYRVEAVPYRNADWHAITEAAALAYTHGAWPPGCNVVASTAARLRQLAAELESGAA